MRRLLSLSAFVGLAVSIGGISSNSRRQQPGRRRPSRARCDSHRQRGDQLSECKIHERKGSTRCSQGEHKSIIIKYRHIPIVVGPYSHATPRNEMHHALNICSQLAHFFVKTPIMGKEIRSSQRATMSKLDRSSPVPRGEAIELLDVCRILTPLVAECIFCWGPCGISSRRRRR